ncbi:MAG TPA: DUF4402 domain-containing protein [Bdellovibrionota bacterium]|nr:DUF4402 domain-containing protein [Bdellovibrionota bacterium]
MLYNGFMLILALAILLEPTSSFAVEPLAISQTSALSFGTAPQGDGPVVIPAGNTETSTNGSFQITGEPNTAYSIVLPSNPITLTTGAGGANETITVSNFQSFPPEGANGALGPGGTQTLYVGATRTALSVNQARGSYSGTFMITISY